MNLEEGEFTHRKTRTFVETVCRSFCASRQNAGWGFANGFAVDERAGSQHKSRV
jgi:hypothetical protein